MPYPQPHPGYGVAPMPYGYPPGYPPNGPGLDMRSGLKAIGEFLPVSFEVLCNEIRGLGRNIELEKSRL